MTIMVYLLHELGLVTKFNVNKDIKSDSTGPAGTSKFCQPTHYSLGHNEKSISLKRQACFYTTANDHRLCIFIRNNRLDIFGSRI